MILPELFYSEEEGEYFWSGEANCAKCNANLRSDIKTPAFLLWDYYRTHFKAVIYCLFCKEHILKAGGKYTEVKHIVCVDNFDLPIDSVMLFPSAPNLSNVSGLSTFDVSIKKDDSKIIDKTVHVHNSNFMIQSDAKSPEQIANDILEKDRLLSFKDADDYLASLKNAEPIIEVEDKPLLGKRKEGEI